ncbi:MAG: hypothetical protein CVT49_15395 [candidate division Zixibacteria bacterium HGW-Zixibacteria-1]|nr:MAG: hypothetical protein CVT49_15395 [candidate division Zixibacteria bacterium HGW-Zixibacteria-1]
MDGYYKLIFSDTLTRNRTYEELKELDSISIILKKGGGNVIDMAATQNDINISTIPNDPLYPQQWNLHHDSLFGINVEGAWEYTIGDSNLIIGIVDLEGIRADQIDLFPRVFGDSYYDGSHGTAMAGIAAANTNNNQLVAGICKKSKIYSSKLGDDIEANFYAIMDAIDCGSVALNNSYGHIPPDEYRTPIRQAMAYAYKMNRVVACSKGNDGSGGLHYPSDYGQGIISVGAHGTDGEYATFANYGNGIDVTAPGEFFPIITSVSTSSWTPFLYGTSLSTAHVTGLAALLYSYDSMMCNDDIENILKVTAKDISDFPADYGYDDYTGWGRINADSAFDILQPPNLLTRKEANGGSEHSHTDFLSMIFIDVPDVADGVYLAKRYEVRKSITFSHPYLTPPPVWGRGVASKGFSAANPNFGMNYVDAIPESITKIGCVLRTWVYDVWTVSGTHVGWKPCAPEYVEFAYTCLGEFELSSAPYISCTNHYDHQSIKVCFEDHNPYEEGWIIERKITTSQSWQAIDTIPNNPDQYFYYEDYYPVGSETYTYRVKPFTSNQQNVAYSNEVAITARPRWPENLVAYATNCFNGIPANPGCNAAVPKTLSAKTTTGEPEPDTLDDGSYPDSYLANDITVRWSYPSNQKYPIVKYIVKKCNTLGSPLKSWTLTGDTCLYVCPNQTDMSFQMNVYSVASNGDTSLPTTRGVRTGNINICPGNITKDFDEIQTILPSRTALNQNYPNPFNLSTEISFSLAEPGHVTIDIYNLLGRKIVTLADGVFEVGEHNILWDGRDILSLERRGIY